jgi:16S rRNA (adenine1518-N6/adenine1519-N6)-dimethyltransferase
VASIIVPPSPKASGSARLASSLPGAEHLPRSGRSSVAGPSSPWRLTSTWSSWPGPCSAIVMTKWWPAWKDQHSTARVQYPQERREAHPGDLRGHPARRPRPSTIGSRGPGPHAAGLCSDGDHRRCNRYSSHPASWRRFLTRRLGRQGEGCVAVQRQWGCPGVAHTGMDRPTPRPDGDTRRCVQFWDGIAPKHRRARPTDDTEPARVIDTLKKRPEYGHIHDTDDLDQHFLVNQEAIEELVGAAELRPGDRVLEIGCGTGNLTRPLAASGAAVIGYEVDERLRRRLYDVERLPNVTIHYRDFLTVNLIQPFDKVVSNPPFSLVEPMLKRFAFTQPTPWMTLVLGQTFSASARAAPDEPQYNRTSLLTQACWEVRQLAELSVADFQPPPRTPAAILQFEPAPDRRDSAIRKLVAKAFVRQAGIKLRDLLALVSSRSRSSERIPPDTLRARIPRDLLNRRLQQIPNEALGIILTAILDAHREADQ